MRKSAPIRQLSLHVDAPQRRKNFKKQFSEDVHESKEKWMQVMSPCISICAKKRDNPPVTKQAWLEENVQQIMQAVSHNKNDEDMVVKKCKEIKRPLTSKLIKQSSLNKESILLSHQELAERLRQAWKEREKEKQNLNIFLNHNIKEKCEDELTDLTDSECTTSEIGTRQTKKVQNDAIPIQQELTDTSYKNIFQKRMRRTHSVDEPLQDYTFSPSRGSDNKVKNVVVVPLTEPLKLKEHTLGGPSKFDELRPKTPAKTDLCFVKNEEQSPKNQKSSKIFDENKPINVIIRPMTAASKREVFRSRVNSAFNTSNFVKDTRPPLVRSSSVPLKQISPKSNFVAVKRRLKSATKKKDKSVKVGHKEEVSNELEDKCKNRKVQRCVSALGPDIITMVSLISPEESESEEHAESTKAKPKIVSALVKSGNAERNDKNDSTKNYNFRKAVKTVSFQQSSIHAVRSFSASFPARRGSVVTTLMLNNSNFDKGPNISTSQEKRATVESGPDDVREPKRRLLRTKSTTSSSSIDVEEDAAAKSLEQSGRNTSTNGKIETDNEYSSTKVDGQDNSENSKKSGDEPDFETPKEKQCWEMYRKMSGKGISISFETILRGMLTPTEYRLRRKSAASLENTDETNATDKIRDDS
ncbi:hypothetical protein FQR65_LT04714 [Abscondita terminalis]|nr:hypothetical protein FQR65_LT04714 [Abscondita terminalis]